MAQPGVAHRRAATAAAMMLLALTASAIPASCRAEGGSLEEAVKATYIYKLADFVTWPPGSLPPDGFRLCLVGQDPFGSLLDSAVSGETVQGRPIIVRRYARITADPGCQIMYVAGGNGQSVRSILHLLGGAPVLTVTDDQEDAAAVGVVNFVIADGHVRFEINAAEAAADHLTISSKLLSLAVRVLHRVAP